MLQLYPIKFKPIFKEKIWGGNKIKTFLGKDFHPLENCGESWEISGVENNVSIVSNGPKKGSKLIDLINEYQDDILGKKVYKTYGNNFPLLVKFIDANDDLSIQVHPNDSQAEKHNSFGKTEMWYIIQADEDASLISGFNQKMSKELFQENIKNDKLYEILNSEQAVENDCFFIPAGRIHTIGKGILLAEIQQSSNITFRIDDFNRKNSQGRKRELHLEEAIDVLDYNYYNNYKTNKPIELNKITELVRSPFFITNRIFFNTEFTRDYSGLDSFVIFTILQGQAYLHSNGHQISIKQGDVILLPAALELVNIFPGNNLLMLETYID